MKYRLHMAAQYPRLVKRSYHDHRDVWLSTDPAVRSLFDEVSSPARLRPGAIQRMATETGIHYKTLESWRSKLKSGAFVHGETVPGSHKKDPRKITPEIEDEIEKCLEDNFIEEDRLCTRMMVRRAMVMTCRQHGLQVKIGDSLINNFMRRHGFSFRLPHVKRRTAPNDQIIASFLGQMDAVKAQFPPELIFNVDETCWRLLNGAIKTLARKGSTEVTITTKVDPKKDITVIAACSLAGERLPLWILAKGKTKRCENKFTESPKLRHALSSGKLFVFHSPDGWSTSDVMIHYLDWIRKRVGERIFHILWDLHASHRAADLAQWATEHDLGLTFIPAGQTDVWQPLDRKIFGVLKKKAKTLFEERVSNEVELGEFELVDAIVVLVEAWEKITPELIHSAWSVLD